ncbi:hypothetical protein Taro_056873 [Colocasia esculenta]|uniref:Uncharacterized protein n=1 Tax=Colocasia esculenta TaxID=4460 RepID=A0A843XXF1_COLES|nr:hypothetical protein [Colocasia esculenta]
MERRLEPGHKWNARIIGGYGHYEGKTFEDDVTSVTPGVDPSNWRTMCEKWNTREEQDIAERNRQNRTHQNMT